MYNTFKDLFSNTNLDNTQEVYPKIRMYKKITVQFVEETNTKYVSDLKFTKLEAPDVGLWVKLFQVLGHGEDQQPSRQLAPVQHLELPQQQPPSACTSNQIAASEVVATALLTDKLPLTEHWVQTD